jgi:hypothetical protein
MKHAGTSEYSTTGSALIASAESADLQAEIRRIRSESQESEPSADIFYHEDGLWHVVSSS